MRLALLLMEVVCSAAGQAPSPGPAIRPAAYDSSRTQVVLLGTGTPTPDPARSGPALAILVHGAAYLVDADHTLGLPDLIFSPWVLERAVPLEVYGPRGIAAMTDHLARAYAEDVRIRTTLGRTPSATGS